MASRVNDRELIVVWLGSFGKEWVSFNRGYTVLDYRFGDFERKGYIERSPNYLTHPKDPLISYRLTDKAIEKGLKDGDNTGNKT